MNAYYQQYSNQHEHRKYPFADDATMRSTGGHQLPVGFFVDAILYPMDSTGPWYIGRIDTAAHTVELQSGDTLCALGTWDDGDTLVHMYDTSGFSRHVGTLVFGTDAQYLTAENPMEFVSAATTMVPTCVMAVYQQGVRGFITDDNKLTTGTVRLLGNNGVEVLSYTDAQGRSVLRVDAYGCPPPSNELCDDNPDIEQIMIDNRAGSLLVGSPGTDGVIYITGASGFYADQLCGTKRLPRSGQLPSENDPCTDSEPPITPFAPGIASQYLVPISDGRIHLVAPSTLAGDNPVKIVNETTAGETPNTTGLSDMPNLDDIQRRVRQMWDMGIRERGLITIKLRGAQ
jgi:hypothetical protein